MVATVRIVVALVVGLVAGATIGQEAPVAIGTTAQIIGELWLNLLRMTIAPLLFLLLATGAASVGKLGRNSLAIALVPAVILFVTAALGAAVTLLLLHLLPIPEAARHAVASAPAVHASVVTSPPAGDWIRSLLPPNLFSALAEDSMVPVVAFSALFGFATNYISADARTAICKALDAGLQTLLAIVRWILLMAPLGVAALAYLAGTRSAVGAAEAMIHYAIVNSAVCVVATAVVYGILASFAPSIFAPFVRSIVASQAMALTTQSSVACLPSMISAAETWGASSGAVRVGLPLALSLFRVGSAASAVSIAIYAAQLSDIHFNGSQLAAGVLLSGAISVVAIGLPSRAQFIVLVSPLCVAIGAPLEGLALLMVADAIPDAFRTVANVTGQLMLVALFDRRPELGYGVTIVPRPESFGSAVQDLAQPLPGAGTVIDSHEG
jgi:proton glutamate symport protein